MHVLVTGSAGFIGSHVCHTLLAAGHTVVGVDNFTDAYDVRLKEWRHTQLKERPGFDFHRLDICDRPAVSRLFEQAGGAAEPFDVVINLAARAGVRQSVEDPWVYFQVNVTGTLNLLESCRRHGVHKFVLASSSSVYGAGEAVPFREDADTSRPISPYAASKKAAEVLCHTYHHLYGLNLTVFRYFTVYGPAGRPDMSPFRFVQWIREGRPVVVYGDGSQSRDFTYVADIARGTTAALSLTGCHTINLGSDKPVALNDMIAQLEALIGRKAQIDRRPALSTDVPRTWADITRARALLGWQPETTFAEGARLLVEWYGENRDWARDIHTG